MEHTTKSGSPRGAELKRQWQQHLKAWRASGESQVAYCRAHGLSRYAFQYWKQNVAEEGSNGFVELSQSATPQPGSVVEILIGDPVRVRVPQGVSAEQLRTVLQAVKEL
jgi:transposase